MPYRRNPPIRTATVGDPEILSKNKGTRAGLPDLEPLDEISVATHSGSPLVIALPRRRYVPRRDNCSARLHLPWEVPWFSKGVNDASSVDVGMHSAA